MASDSGPGSLKELATSRTRFVAELGERLGSIRQGLARVGATTDGGGELNAVRRRLHALAAAADVLHFTAAADALRRAETDLASLASSGSSAPARERVTRVLDLLPSLALGAAVDVREEVEPERVRTQREPLSVLVFGDLALEAALHEPGPLRGVDTHVTRELDQLLPLVTRLAPDVLLLDGDDPRLPDALPRLRQAAGSSPFSLVAVGSFESYEGMLRLVRRGVSRVLPTPVNAAALQRTLQRLVPREPPSAPRPNPFDGAGAHTLVDLVAREARTAFFGAPSGVAPALDSDGAHHALTALWSAFARIRLLAAKSGEGALRFPLQGPDGMIPLAPALAPGRTPNAHETTVGEALAGRRFVVADADPTLLGALTRALQRLGASVLPARDGAQALELCERQWPDALISDASLPTLSGFQLCRELHDDIALADLPVAVICWKEHLLEQARRLTEAQHGHERALDPDSFAPLAEALSQRLALERRLERHDAVHGRVDGLTPRLLLQLACSRTPSALLSLRAGRLTLEVAVVDGRPTHARLLDAGAVAAEGQAALGPFLGMRVGRFSLEPLATVPPPHFSADVMTVLAPAIARARRARAWLASPDAPALERVELQPGVTALYLEEAPAAHKALASRLLRGESPRALWDPADTSATSDGAQLSALLLELTRRGALLTLIDATGRDVLDPDGARGSEAARDSDPPPPPLPAALSLAEAVLQAVSAPVDGAPDKPSARRTNPGVAPPAPPVEPYRRTAGSPPLSELERHAGRRPSVPPPPREGRSSVVPVAPAVAARPSSVPPPPDGRPSTLPPAPEPREVTEAWSSEPDDDDDPQLVTADPSRPGAALDDEPAATFAGRARSVVGPVVVTLGAAALAFGGMRVILGGALDGLGVQPSTQILGNRVADAGAEPHGLPLPGLPPTSPQPSDAGGATPPALPGLARGGVPIDVDVTTEVLDPAPQPRLIPGHGLLEVRTWEPQRIYVDDVFVGHYASRLVPLEPGNHRVRLLGGAREIEQPVQIEAGRRTRVWARSKSAE